MGQVQQAALRCGHLPGEHDVFEVLLAKRHLHRLFGIGRKLVLCASANFVKPSPSARKGKYGRIELNEI
jgi:hypothetical protein